MSEPGATQPLHVHFQQQLAQEQLAMVTASNYGYSPYKYSEYPIGGTMPAQPHPQLRPTLPPQGSYGGNYGMMGNVYANKKYAMSPPVVNQHYEKSQQQGMMVAGSQQVHPLSYQQPTQAYISTGTPHRIMGYVNQQSPRMMGYMNQTGYGAQPSPQMYNVPKQCEGFMGDSPSQWVVDGGSGGMSHNVPMAVGFAEGVVNQTYNMTVYTQPDPGHVYQADLTHRQPTLPNNLHSPAAVIMNNVATRQPFPQQLYQQHQQQQQQQFCVQQQPEGAFSPCANITPAVYRGHSVALQGSEGTTYDSQQQCISTMAGLTCPSTVACLTTCVTSASTQSANQHCLYNNLQYHMGVPHTIGGDNRVVIRYPQQGMYGSEAGGINVSKMLPGARVCELKQPLLSSAMTLSVVSNSIVTQSAMQHTLATTTFTTLPTNQTVSGCHGGGGMSCCQDNRHQNAIGSEQVEGQTYSALRQSLPLYNCPNATVNPPVVSTDHLQDTVPLSHVWTKEGAYSASDSTDSLTCVTVPFGWKRVIENGIVVYYSPSEARLTSASQMCQYLLMDGTCKCGLECPLLLDRVFHFDPNRLSKPWSPNDIKRSDDVTKLCCHKRKIIAMATFQNTTSMQKVHPTMQQAAQGSQEPQGPTQKKLGRKVKSCSRKRRKKTAAVTSPYDGMFVSQLLLCRDKQLEKTLPPLNGPQDPLMPTPELEALLNESAPQKEGKKCDTTPQTSSAPPAEKDTTNIPEDTSSATKDQLHSDANPVSISQVSVATAGQQVSTDGTTKVMQTNLGNPFVMGCERGSSQKFVRGGFSAPQAQQRALFPARDKFSHGFTSSLRMSNTIAAPRGYGFPAMHQPMERCGGDANAMYAVRQPGMPPNIIHMMDVSGHMTPSHAMVMNNAAVQPEPPGGAITGQPMVMQTLGSPNTFNCQHTEFDQRPLGDAGSFHPRGQYPATQYWPHVTPTRRKVLAKDCQSKAYNSVFSNRSPCPNVDVRQMWQSQNVSAHVGGTSVTFHKNSVIPSTMSPCVTSRDTNEQQMEQLPAVDNGATETNQDSQKSVSTKASFTSVVTQPKCSESQPPEGTATSSPSCERDNVSAHHSDVSCESLASDSLSSHALSTFGTCHTSSGKMCDTDLDSGSSNKSTPESQPSSVTSVTSVTDMTPYPENSHYSVPVQPTFNACDFPASNLLSAAAKGQLNSHSVVSPDSVDAQTVVSETPLQSPMHVSQSPGYTRQAVSETPPAAPRRQPDGAAGVNGECRVSDVEQSPIQMVQNMISGLEATQNQLAKKAMNKKPLSRRRRTAYSSDPCGQSVNCPDSSVQRNSSGSEFTCSFSENVTNSNGELADANMASVYTSHVPTGIISSAGMPPMSVGTVTAVTNAITQLIPSTQQTNHSLHQEQALLKPTSLQEMHAGTAPHATIGLLLGQQPQLTQQVINQQMMVLQPPSLDQVIGQQVMMGQPPTAQCPPMMHVVSGLGTPVNPVVMINQLGQSADALPSHPVMLTSVTPVVMAGFNDLTQRSDKDKHTDQLAQVSDELDGQSGERETTDQLPGNGQTEAVTGEKTTQRSGGKRLVGRKGRKGKRKDRCKKSSTPTIASMLQAAHSPAAALQQQQQQQQQQLMQLTAAVPSQPVQLSLTTPMLQTQLLQHNTANFGQGLVSDVQLCAGQLLTAQPLSFDLGGVATITCPAAGDQLAATQDRGTLPGAAIQNFTMPNVEMLMKQLSAAAQNPAASAQILQSWAQNLEGQNNLIMKNLQSLQQQHQQLLSGSACVADGNTLVTSDPVTDQHTNTNTIQARNPVLASALAQGVCGTTVVDSNNLRSTSTIQQVEPPDQDVSTEASERITAGDSDDGAPSSVNVIYSPVVDTASTSGKIIITEGRNSDMSDTESSTQVNCVTEETSSVSPSDSGSFAMNNIPNPMNLTAAVSAVMKGQQLDAYTCESVATATSRSRSVRHVRTNRLRAHGRAIRRRYRLDMHNNIMQRRRIVPQARGVWATRGGDVGNSVVTQTPTALDLTMPPAGTDSALTTEGRDKVTNYGSSSTRMSPKTDLYSESETSDSRKNEMATDDDVPASNSEGTHVADTEENADTPLECNDGSDDTCHDGGNTDSCHGDDVDMVDGYQEEPMETQDGNQEEDLEALERGQEENMIGCHDSEVSCSCEGVNTGEFEGCEAETLQCVDSCHGNASLQETCEKGYMDPLDSPASVKSDQSGFTATSPVDISNGDFDEDSDQDEPINLSNNRSTTVTLVDKTSCHNQSDLRRSKDSDLASSVANEGDDVIYAQSTRAPSSCYDNSSDECGVSDWTNDNCVDDSRSPDGSDVIKENGGVAVNSVYCGTEKQLETRDCHISREAKRLMIDRQMEDSLPAEDNEDELVDTCSAPRIFNTGDVVWGEIRGYPSWPGKIVHESEVRGHHESEDGKVWVRWFGDHTFTQVEPVKLKTLSEGLDAQHRETKKHRKGRRMNSTLESAIQEAMMELDKPDTEVTMTPLLKHMTVKSVTTAITCASTEATAIMKTGKTKIGKKQKCR